MQAESQNSEYAGDRQRMGPTSDSLSETPMCAVLRAPQSLAPSPHMPARVRCKHTDNWNANTVGVRPKRLRALEAERRGMSTHHDGCRQNHDRHSTHTRAPAEAATGRKRANGARAESRKAYRRRDPWLAAQPPAQPVIDAHAHSKHHRIDRKNQQERTPTQSKQSTEQPRRTGQKRQQANAVERTEMQRCSMERLTFWSGVKRAKMAPARISRCAQNQPRGVSGQAQDNADDRTKRSDEHAAST